MTVVFCDLVGSTPLAQQLDAEDWRDVLAQYEAAASAAVARWGGHVAKSLGDGLLIYFGWPRAREDDPERAVRAGLAILEAMVPLNATRGAGERTRLAARIGIHTGPVVIADDGEVFGDTANIAARVQSAAEPDTVVMTAATQRLVAGIFVVDDRGPQTLKGVRDPVVLYRVVQPSGVRSRLDVAAGRLSHFVGREVELATLLERWERVQDGEGQNVVVLGEAGVGKSRLTHQLRARLADALHTWLECRCSPYTTATAFHPLIGLVEQGLAFQDADTAAEKLAKLERALMGVRLAEAVPLLAAFLALPVPERYPSLEMAPELRRRKTLEVLAAWNLALGELQPMVLLVEDLHWCDPSSLELLGRLVEQSSTARVLLLLTARPELAVPWPTRSNLTTLQLARLTKRQAREMVAGVSGEALPTEVLETIVARADGVPLYLEELTKAVVEPGAVRSVEAIPTTLQDSLMARLDRLSAAKEVAQRAAVLGREFSYALLAASVAMEEAALRRGLVCLVDAEILFARGEPPNATYTFKHALIQESAYSSLLRRTRLELHGRVVRALVAHFPERVDAEPEIVARHAERAGLMDEAVTYYQRAGERAVARSALLEAAGHFTTALQLLGTLPNAPGRAQETLDLQVLLGQALAATKGYGAREVTDAFARARELARQVGGTPQLLSVLFGLWTSIAGQGEFRIARDLAHELLAVAERARMRAEMVWGHLAHGINNFSLGDAATAREHLAQVVALYKTGERRASPSDPGVMALSYASFNSWTLGLIDEAREHSRESLELAERLRNPLAVAWAGFFTAMLHVVLREPLRALEHAEPVIALCTEHQFSLFVGLTTIVRGAAISEDGRHEEGLAELRKGLGLYFATGQRVSHRLYLALLAQACMAAGAIDEAAATVEEALGMRTDERFFEPELHRLRAELLCRQGAEPARVEGSFRAGIELARGQAARALELRAATSYARWLRAARRADEAQQHLDEVWRWFPGGLDIRDLVDAKALLEELQPNS